jgi:hypothetical protein
MKYIITRGKSQVAPQLLVVLLRSVDVVYNSELDKL